MLPPTVGSAMQPQVYRSTPPVVIENKVYRFLEGRDHQWLVMEWDGAHWAPSLMPAYRIRDAEAALTSQLVLLRVPRSDWLGTVTPMWQVPLIWRLDGPPPGTARLVESQRDLQ